jgi:hypothetical protein
MIVDQSQTAPNISKLVKISCAEHLYVELIVGQYIGNKMSIFCVTKNKHINAVVCAGILKQLVRKDLRRF